jgi:hypothetical protein
MKQVLQWRPDMVAIPGQVIFEPLSAKLARRTVDRTVAFLDECIALNKVRN